ncbi:MAG TPA: DUF1810 domain-containing protein [Sphingomicrobium sp.]|nr:DUF1810 domain-containing protein [Sphingomicrobium sp.]
MSDPYNLQRFVDAQASTFTTALSELKAGLKQSHWMWFIFPQLAGLGNSPTARMYAISSLNEAFAYCRHPLLGQRLRQSVEALLPWSSTRTVEQILGPVDAMKLRSSLTLFARAGHDDLYARALQLFFDAEPDHRTLALLNAEA